MDGSSMRIRTEWRADECLLRLAIRHPMDPERTAEDGTVTPSRFITRLQVSHADEVLLLAHWGPGISRNPYLEFSFTGAARGDPVVIEWEDSRGERDRLTATL
jgi:sulfur-oxidizing protein SoxZ